jgi:hypothetical protein
VCNECISKWYKFLVQNIYVYTYFVTLFRSSGRMSTPSTTKYHRKSRGANIHYLTLIHFNLKWKCIFFTLELLRIVVWLNLSNIYFSFGIKLKIIDFQYQFILLFKFCKIYFNLGIKQNNLTSKIFQNLN